MQMRSEMVEERSMKLKDQNEIFEDRTRWRNQRKEKSREVEARK